MAIWKCPGCSFAYDVDDDERLPGMDEMIPFEEIPADWACPGCGVKKTEFRKMEKD